VPSTVRAPASKTRVARAPLVFDPEAIVRVGPYRLASLVSQQDSANPESICKPPLVTP
jgi:hypothetical protein